MGEIDTPGEQQFPKGIGHAFFFAALNGLSFQIVLSSPIILYAKSLGASSTVVGLIAGMMPLLVIFQIPAASHIPRFGYKRFVYAGWSVRVVFIALLALVPLAGAFLNRATQLALVIFLLFAYNLARGISSCGWLPWISSLIHPSIRGRYLARDAACTNLASFLTILIAAFCLGDNPGPWNFATLFAWSALAGAASLFFLKRIPDAEIPESERKSTTPVPWGAIAGFEPFRKLLRLNLAWSVSYGGLSAFTVAYLKNDSGMGEQDIVLVTSVAFLGGLCSLWFLGSRMDRLGSKPILSFSILCWIGIVTGWAALAGNLLNASVPIVLVLQFLMGLGVALINMANLRLAMALPPALGRSHFLALFSVVANVSLGLSPIFWGLLLDSFNWLRLEAGGFELNRFSLFFLLVIGCLLVTLRLCQKLQEPSAAQFEDLMREVFIQSPRRVWLRLWPRL